MSPQVGVGFNRDYWRRLEDTIRQQAINDDVKEVYVFTGPLLMPKEAPRQGNATGTFQETDEAEADAAEASDEPLTVTYRLIGGNHVPVPTHYFKALLVVPVSSERSVKMFTYVLPNEKINKEKDLGDFARSVDYVEHWAGFDLWSAVPDDVEAYKEGTDWNPAGPLVP